MLLSLLYLKSMGFWEKFDLQPSLLLFKTVKKCFLNNWMPSCKSSVCLSVFYRNACFFGKTEAIKHYCFCFPNSSFKVLFWQDRNQDRKCIFSIQSFRLSVKTRERQMLQGLTAQVTNDQFFDGKNVTNCYMWTDLSRKLFRANFFNRSSNYVLFPITTRDYLFRHEILCTNS